MILGFDHLAKSVTNTAFSIQEMEREGYVCEFKELGIFNHPQKKNLLSNYKKTHDLVIMRHPDKKIPIELTNHGLLGDAPADYRLNNDFIELNVHDNLVVSEVDFWQQALRFNLDDEGFLQLRTPVPTWGCKVKIIPVLNNEKKISTLDSAEYPCIALLSNELDKDIKILLEHGVKEMTQPFSLTVNNKEIVVIMFRTPAGAIVEIIELKI